MNKPTLSFEKSDKWIVFNYAAVIEQSPHSPLYLWVHLFNLMYKGVKSEQKLMLKYLEVSVKKGRY